MYFLHWSVTAQVEIHTHTQRRCKCIYYNEALNMALNSITLFFLQLLLYDINCALNYNCKVGDQLRQEQWSKIYATW